MKMNHDIFLQIEKPEGNINIKLSQDVHLVICTRLIPYLY